jgi:hypothetical protein
MKTPILDMKVLDLGKDRARMTSSAAADQHASVNCLLGAFFGPAHQRREVQLLADEVGLGKTFVALSVAYTMLAAMRERNSPRFVADLGNAYRAVVVVTPQGNHALAAKWGVEVGALVKRCGLQPEALRWFTAAPCNTPEDLLIALRKASDLRRKPGSVPTVLVCEAGMFTRKIRESGAKLRFLAASLFQWSGNALQHEVRRHIVRRAAAVRGFEDWAQGIQRGECVELWDFAAHQRFLALAPDDLRREEFTERRSFDAMPFTYNEMRGALEHLARSEDGQDALYSEILTGSADEGPRGIVPYCKWVAEKSGKAELLFDGFKTRVSALYRSLFPSLMGGTIPLVIADEAHHWRRETQGCRSFVRYLAPFTHRLLLLTATPFQLCPDELNGILSRADALEQTIGTERVAELRRKRGLVLCAMEKSENAGREFSKLWGRLADDLRSTLGETQSIFGHGAAEGDRLTQQVAVYWRELISAGGYIGLRLQALPGRVRPFFAAALELRKANSELGDTMSELVIRHRRDTAHRSYRVGHEYPPIEGEPLRPDQHQLHAARGSELPPDAELAQFLLMKVVASATRGHRKTALGMDVTGAYSTLWNSSEGKKAVAAAAKNEAQSYFRLLAKFTGGKGIPNRSDPQHPKIRLAVQDAVERWDRDEKTLIFCFRIPTATVLRDLISEQIEKRIASARRELLRGHKASSEKAALAQFKGSLTARTGSVLPAFMDRVLLGLAQRRGWQQRDLELDDLRDVAELAARARTDGKSAVRDVQKPDRVLLARICEHVLARKYQKSLVGVDGECGEILSRISETAWIETRYGLDRSGGASVDSDEAADLLTRSSLSASYQLTDTVDVVVFDALLRAFKHTHERKTVGLLESLIGGPNFFVPLAPFHLEAEARKRAANMTDQLWNITLQPDGMQWRQRGEVVDAVNRALLRDHFLLRLPRKVFAGGDERWSEALVRGFHSPHLFGRTGEPVAAKIADFIQELAQMATDERARSLRYALNARGKAVVLVSGSTQERDSVFRGFNSPLLPEILICTSVGQEGIDLHRHCRHVVHYDLGWNPATIEQRTGRVDRIGSKTQRERNLKLSDRVSEIPLPGLEVGLPYLAATYDERIFYRLYTRAQAFDLLTGGDPSADPDDERDYGIEGVEEPGRNTEFVALPDEMRSALRVELRASRQSGPRGADGLRKSA